jgi:hypothetical protein
MNNPFGLGTDLSNKGMGDVSVLLTRRLGAINDTVVTLSVGAPTGSHDATLKTQLLRQDQQLGAGKLTGSLMIDHTIDNIWGPTVVGGLASYRGGENELGSYRAPNATLYAYTSYFLGPFAPAIGLQLTGSPKHDTNLGDPMLTPLFSAAAQVSVEWATDWVAILVGAVVPYGYDGEKVDVNGASRNPWGLGAWLVGVGLAFAPF